MLVKSREELESKIDCKETGNSFVSGSQIVFVKDKNGTIYCFETGSDKDWNGYCYQASEIVDSAEKAEKSPCLIMPYELRKMFKNPAFSGRKEELAPVEYVMQNGEIVETKTLGYAKNSEGYEYEEGEKMLNQKTICELKDQFEKYGPNDWNLFKAEYGWADWMQDFTEAADGEEMSEWEGKEIEKAMAEVWCDFWKDNKKIAHARKADGQVLVFNYKGRYYVAEDIYEWNGDYYDVEESDDLGYAKENGEKAQMWPVEFETKPGQYDTLGYEVKKV